MLEESLTQLVVTTVVEGTGMETRLFHKQGKGRDFRPILISSTRMDHSKNCLQFKVYYGFLGFPQRETGYLRPLHPFALRYGVLRAFLDKIWNKARGCFVVASEISCSTCTSSGKELHANHSIAFTVQFSCYFN